VNRQLRVSIAIVSYNSRDVLRECLKSIFVNSKEDGWVVWVVDNASSDNTLEMVRGEFPQVNTIANATNLGFAAACNQGIRHAAGNSILLLNPDTVLLADAVDKLTGFVQSHPEVGIVGPLVYDNDDTDSVQHSCRRFPTYVDALFGRSSFLTRAFPHNKLSGSFLMSAADHSKTMEVDWVSGCCMLVRREVFQTVGLLDEEFRFGFEDVDLCQRAKRAGWKVFYYPEAKIVHYIGSARAETPVHSIITRHQSMKHYYDKYHRRSRLLGIPVVLAIYTKMMLVIASTSLRCVRRLLRGPEGGKDGPSGLP